MGKKKDSSSTKGPKSVRINSIRMNGSAAHQEEKREQDKGLRNFELRRKNAELEVPRKPGTKGS